MIKNNQIRKNQIMNKQEMIEIVYKNAKINKKDCKNVINLFLNLIKDSLNKGQTIHLKMFGNLKVKEERVKRLYSPTLNKYYLTTKKTKVVFTPSKQFFSL